MYTYHVRLTLWFRPSISETHTFTVEASNRDDAIAKAAVRAAHKHGIGGNVTVVHVS